METCWQCMWTQWRWSRRGHVEVNAVGEDGRWRLDGEEGKLEEKRGKGKQCQWFAGLSVVVEHKPWMVAVAMHFYPVRLWSGCLSFSELAGYTVTLGDSSTPVCCATTSFSIFWYQLSETCTRAFHRLSLGRESGVEKLVQFPPWSKPRYEGG